jgi:hypothetical protein
MYRALLFSSSDNIAAIDNHDSSLFFQIFLIKIQKLNLTSLKSRYVTCSGVLVKETKGRMYFVKSLSYEGLSLANSV